MMLIDRNTTVQDILAERLDALQIFEKHGVEVPVECAENIQSCALELCDSMCHIDDLDALIADLQKFFEQPAPEQAH